MRDGLHALVPGLPRFPPSAGHGDTTAVRQDVTLAMCPSCRRSRSPRAVWTRRCVVRTIVSALAPGINALKTFDPPLDALAGRSITAIRRRGKHLVVDVTGDLSLLLHLMSAGRLQLFDKQAGPRDRTSRLLVRLADGRELRLREFGTRQAAWVKLLPDRGGRGGPGDRRARAGGLARPAAAARAARAAGRPPAARRPARPARDHRHRPLVGGRDPVDRPAVAVPARRRPRRGAGRPRCATRVVGRLGDALDHYERVVTLPIPDKLPLPLLVHRHARRAVPGVRHDDRGDPLRELRALLLPDRPDRRARAQGPPPVAAAQVDRADCDDAARFSPRDGLPGPGCAVWSEDLQNPGPERTQT